VPDLPERREQPTVEALRRRIGRDDGGKGALELLQLRDQPVVGGVRDTGTVQRVVEMVVVPDAAA
jgi:hypothetical protein